MGGQQPGQHRTEEEEEYDNPDRRIHWQIFIGSLVAMVLVALLVALLMQSVRLSARDAQITKRAKYEACQSLETDLTRTICLNGMG